MLDAYIINRIRQEKEREERDGSFVPLRIEKAPPQVPDRRRNGDADRDEQTDERGSVIVDFLC